MYFTCHPADLDRSFEKICADIFRTQDVAIYYMDEEERAAYDPALLESDLRQMNLFVIPVSAALLTEANPVMQFDLPFAKKEHIPILPIMLDEGIEHLYSQEGNFGTIQYLYPHENDETAIEYEAKLEKFLKAVILGTEMTDRIRAIFDGHIFLSYRKMDRIKANELMRLIHEDPVCRDIAIWYDEFLMPGEKFDNAIMKALVESDIFVLLVTPNIIQEGNYVQQVEYPKARETEKDILPVEMTDTDRNELENKFPQIPECLKTDDKEQLKSQINTTLKKVADPGNDRDPEHLLMLGLAYLDGVDVEINRQMAAEMIGESAEAGYFEAMLKLSEMYHKGIGVEISYKMYLEWLEKAAAKYSNLPGKDENVEFELFFNLANAYFEMSQPNEAARLLKYLSSKAERKWGRSSLNTLKCYNNLAKVYSTHGKPEKASELFEEIKILARSAELPDEFHLELKRNLALHDQYYVDDPKKIEIERLAEVYEENRRMFGEDDERTLVALTDLVEAYRKKGDDEKVSEMSDLVYRTYQKYKAKNKGESAVSLKALEFVASVLSDRGDHSNALTVFGYVFHECERIMGAKHAMTISNKQHYAYECVALGEFGTAVKTYEELYDNCRDIIEIDKELLRLICLPLAVIYEKAGHKEDADKYFEIWYNANRTLSGDEEEDAINTLLGAASSFAKMDDHDKAVKILEVCYEACKKTYTENHQISKDVLSKLRSERVMLQWMSPGS